MQPWLDLVSIAGFNFSALRLQKLLTVASWLSRLVISFRMTPRDKLVCNRPPATLSCRGAWYAASQPSARPGAGESGGLCPHRALCEAAVRRRRGDRETSEVISRPRRRNRRNRSVCHFSPDPPRPRRDGREGRWTDLRLKLVGEWASRVGQELSAAEGRLSAGSPKPPWSGAA